MRHSISRAPPLALEASDAAAEMQDPGQKPGQKPDWWQKRQGTHLPCLPCCYGEWGWWLSEPPWVVVKQGQLLCIGSGMCAE